MSERRGRPAGRAVTAAIRAAVAVAVLATLAGCTTGGTASSTAATPTQTSLTRTTSAQTTTAHTGATRTTATDPADPVAPSTTLASPAGSGGEPGTVPTGPPPSDTTVGATSKTQPSIGAVRELPDGVAPGLSGLAPGPTAGTFYAVDDMKGTSDVVVIRADGSLVGRIEVEGMAARNAEAMGVAKCGQHRCLYVADIGDNVLGRDDIVIYRIVDPVIGKTAEPEIWRYTYPDGPHNAEAFFPLADGTIVIISKPGKDAAGNIAPHRIYRGRPGGGELTLVTTFDPPKPPSPLQSLLVGNVVTDAAYDGKRVLLLTYDQVVEYRAPSESADPAKFPSWATTQLPHPVMVQTEAIASSDCGYLVGSEEGPGGSSSAVAGVC